MDSHRVLFIGLVWPEPKSSAASQNILSYIRLFREQGFNVTFACAAEKTEQSAALNSLGVSEKKVQLNDSSFDFLVTQIQPSIVVFDRFISEEQFGWRVSESAPNCLKIMDCEDLHFLREARHKAHKAGIDSSKASLVKPYLYTDLCKRELASILRCDLAILLSPAEVMLLQSTFGISPDILHYCPFLLAECEQRSHKDFKQRADFISIGSFRHAPNWDAVLTLKNMVWPLIHKALPEAKLHIYGSYLTPKAKQLENKKEGFLVHGFAADAFEVIGSAKVLLAPLNFGAGIKGKLVDAMQCGTPSVTTELGAEGLLPEVSEDDVLLNTVESQKNAWPESAWAGAINNVFESATAFANSAIELYSSQTKWDRANNKAEQLFKARFDYAEQSVALMEKIERCFVNIKEHRQRHFLGQVLQHHSVLSAKYMSQWIEAKNRPLGLQECIKTAESAKTDLNE